MSRSAISALTVTILTAALLVATLVVGNRPLLGLDLQGGAEIVLRPRQDPVNLELASEPENMERAASIIRQRVDAIGVAEPDVTVQGTDIVVQLPGVDDQSRAIELVGQTAQLRFRPVLLGPVPLEQILALQSLTDQAGVNADAETDGDTDGGDTDAGDGDTDTGGDTDGTDAGDGDTDAGDTDDAGDGDTDDAGDGDTDAGDSSEEGMAVIENDNPTIGVNRLTSLVPGEESAFGLFQTETETPPAETPEAETPEADEATPEAETPEADEATPEAETPAAETDETDPAALDEAPDPTDLFDSVPGVNGGAGAEEFYTGQITAPEDDIEDQSVVLVSAPDQGPPQLYLLGPTVFTGSALEGAQAVFGTGWSVLITFRPGDDGIGNLNRAAEMCYSFSEQCPEGQIAVVLDSFVESQNGFEAPTFSQREVTLSSGNPLGFEEQDARDTAVVLDFGALPLTFDDPAEAGLVRSVSATLGRTSLEAGITAGAFGLLIVSLYMFWVYGLLGLAAILSLVVSSSLLWVIVSYLSDSQGLALTLAGIVGLIVAIGVSLDSNIVYFEQIKEYVAGGNSLRRSADRSFPESFRTVFWANLATLIGAIILYLLTIGSVRGFALMLGIASVLDLFATYFFMRPVVDLLVHSNLGTHPRWFGVLADHTAEPSKPKPTKSTKSSKEPSSSDSSGKDTESDSSGKDTESDSSGEDTESDSSGEDTESDSSGEDTESVSAETDTTEEGEDQ